MLSCWNFKELLDDILIIYQEIDYVKLFDKII